MKAVFAKYSKSDLISNFFFSKKVLFIIYANLLSKFLCLPEFFVLPFLNFNQRAFEQKKLYKLNFG